MSFPPKEYTPFDALVSNSQKQAAEIAPDHNVKNKVSPQVISSILKAC